MAQELKSGSIILSPEDAEYFEQLKEFKRLSNQNKFVIKEPSFWGRSTIFYWAYGLKDSSEYKSVSEDELIQKLQKANDDLSKKIEFLMSRNIWGRIINKY